MEFDKDLFDKPITIVYPATVDWYLLYQRPQQLLTRMAKYKNVRCIFITTEAYKKLPRPIVKIDEEMYVVNMHVNYGHLLKGTKVLLFSYPNHWDRAKYYDFTIFDALDNPADEFSAWKNGIKKSEEVADIISCTADVMYQEHKKSGKRTFMCPNGADFDHFKKAHHQLPIPADFPLTNEVVVGFYGALASWVDYELIDEIAKEFKVVLVGANKWYTPKTKSKNVVTLNHKDYKHLPYYLSQFDVTMVPFKLSEMIKGCDPIKYYEYLSAGKPVVCTDMVELRKYSDVTYFMDKDNAIEMVYKAYVEDSIEKQKARMEVAQANSWDARVHTMLMEIKEGIYVKENL